MLFALLLTAGSSNTNAEPLDQFLARMGLADLRLHHLEQQAAAETDSAKQQAAARGLADAYAEQLIDAADDAERYAGLQRRLEVLLARVPEARTPAIEVVLLQAHYQRAETHVLRWLEDPAAKQDRKEAMQLLAMTAPKLTDAQKTLSAAVEQGAEALEQLPTEAAKQAAEQQLGRQQAVAARAGYFAGWSHYYLGVVLPEPAVAEPHFRAAQQHFAAVLDLIGEVDYSAVEAESLGLESVWRSRAVIGLGVTELGLRRREQAAAVFGWLEHDSVPTSLRDQAAYWQLQGLLNVGLLDAAAAFVEQQVASFGHVPSVGKSSLCLTALRAGAQRASAPIEQRQKLADEGIRGLVRMRQFETLEKTLGKHDLRALLGDNFLLAWLAARQKFLAAEKTKAAEDYDVAQSELTAVLARPESTAEMAAAAQARYYLAWCHYRRNDRQRAARLFQESATALRGSLDDLAAQAVWMHCTALVQLAAEDKPADGNKRQSAAALAALAAFQQDYPASENAKRAELLALRLRQSQSSPEESLQALAAIAPSDPNYLAAQFEIVQLRHQLWTKAKADTAKAAKPAAALLQATDRYLALSRQEPDPARRLKTALIAVDVLQAAPRRDEARITGLLNLVAADASQVQPHDAAAIEYQYRRLEQAQRSDDPSAARTAAEHIARHGGGTPFELPALVIVARAADGAVKAASAAERAARLQEAAAIYERLVRKLGESPEQLAKDKNSLAASSKLAQYDGELGRWKEAADRYEQILKALPSDRRFLRRAGLASAQAGRHDVALAHWRKLLGGVASGSDDWYEAKYYHLLALRETDPAAAAKAWKQFTILYPEVTSAAWRDQFAELAIRFSSSDS